MAPNIPRVVNDTNVWLSALYFSGKPARIVSLIEDHKAVSVTSDFILEELKEKLVLDFDTPAYAAISYIASISQTVTLKGKNFNLRDPDDNKVLETAVVGKSNFLITGDKDLLTLGRYDQIQIVAPEEFLRKIR